MIKVINAGCGNINSVIKIILSLNSNCLLAQNDKDLQGANKIILPGVGSFNSGMRNLENNKLSSKLKDLSKDKSVKILGICLGMQLLCKSSEEGELPGLGLVDAEVKRFVPSAKFKIPHMVWNTVRSLNPNDLLPDNGVERRFYFVHSYFVKPSNPSIVAGTTQYGTEFCAAFQQENIFGVQFHPEKSHRFGKELMRRFLDL